MAYNYTLSPRQYPTLAATLSRAPDRESFYLGDCNLSRDDVTGLLQDMLFDWSVRHRCAPLPRSATV